MSLESKIDALIEAVNAQTTAINAFNGNIEKWLTAPTHELVTVTGKVEPTNPIEVAEPEESEPEQSLTHKDVQDAVLSFVRKDVKTNKPKVKTLLDKYNANKVGDINESDLVAFKKELDVL